MPCRAGPSPEQRNSALRQDLKERERELCDARTTLMKVVEKLPAEELSEDLENAVAKHRTAHIDHRKGDLDHAREEAHRALKKANGREDKIRRMGGRPGEGIERAQRAAKHAVEIVENLEPKDLVDNDQPLQNAYDLVEQARNML